MIEQGAVVTIGLFVIGLVFHAGRMSARLDAVERRVAALEEARRAELAEIKQLLQSAIGGRRHVMRNE